MDELLLIGNCSPRATCTSSAAKDVKHELEATTYSEKEDILSKPDTNKKNITCSICTLTQPAINFSTYAQRASAITRCRACSIACSKCLKPCTTARMFASGTSMCWTCHKQPRICSRCQHQLSDANFKDGHITRYYAKKIKFLVCTGCQSQGYRQNNIDEIPCRHGHTCGRAAFDNQSIRHWRKRGKIPVCIACTLQKRCHACKMRKNTDQFDRTILQNARRQNRRLVCSECQAIGYSPRDCTAYPCFGSHHTEPHWAGHLKFTNADLSRVKRNHQTQISLCCVDCKGKPEEQRGKKRALNF